MLFVVHRVHGLEKWSDSPFSIMMYENIGFDWSEPITEGMGLALYIVLVDAGTGILLAQRIIGTSTDFALELRAAIFRQHEHPFSKKAYYTKIEETYNNYTSKDLLLRSIAKHTAGEEVGSDIEKISKPLKGFVIRLPIPRFISSICRPCNA